MSTSMTLYAYKDTKMTKAIHRAIRMIAEKTFPHLDPPNSPLQTHERIPITIRPSTLVPRYIKSDHTTSF